MFCFVSLNCSTTRITPAVFVLVSTHANYQFFIHRESLSASFLFGPAPSPLTFDVSMLDSHQASSTMSITVYGNLTIKKKTTITTHANRRRSQRVIARQANPERIPDAPRAAPRNARRDPLPSVHDDPWLWEKIFTLPANLRLYLTPEWRPQFTTCNILRQLIWHFKPSQRIPCRMLKADIIELFQYHVVQKYGAHYGI